MTTATIRINTSTREQLQELAAQTGMSMQALLEEAVAAYRGRLSRQKDSVPVQETERLDAKDELSDDPNVLAYKSLDETFLTENEGKYAAFCDGELVATSTEKAQVHHRIRQEYPSKLCLIVKLSKESRVV